MVLRSHLDPDDTLYLHRPVGVDDDQWDAIEDSASRLRRAIDVNDLPLSIGSAKELVESVAKVVLALRGEVVASNEKFGPVLDRAHRALGRKASEGEAGTGALRDVSQAMRTLAGKVGDLRNTFGTGHGRSSLTAADLEVALSGIEAALAWSRWALRRIGILIQNSPTQLASDLVGGETFTRGLLTRRLQEAGLPSLDAPDQRLLGLSVAWRAQRETFVVREDGVERCTESDDLHAWPIAYREGVAEGLIYDRDGRLDLSDWGIRQLSQLVVTSGDGNLLERTVERVMQADYSPRMSDGPYRERCADALRSADPEIPAATKPAWQQLRERLNIPF